MADLIDFPVSQTFAGALFDMGMTDIDRDTRPRKVEPDTRNRYGCDCGSVCDQCWFPRTDEYRNQKADEHITELYKRNYRLTKELKTIKEQLKGLISTARQRRDYMPQPKTRGGVDYEPTDH